MAWKEAAGLKTLKEQFDVAFPGRDRASDGAIGNAEHAARSSDHNPNGRGYVCARDFDEDVKPKSKAESERLMRSFGNELAAYASSGLPGSDRVKYVVYEDQVASGTYRASWWRFRGSGYGHTHHLHLSVTQAAEKDGQRWPLPIFGFPAFDVQRRQAAEAKKAAVKKTTADKAPAKKAPAKKVASTGGRLLD